MWRAALALLCELSCVNMKQFLELGLVRILTNALLECPNMQRLSDAVTGCLMRIYCDPELRSKSGIDMSLILSPFTELPHTDSQDTAAAAR